MGLFESVALRTVQRGIRRLSGEKIPTIAGHKLLYTCNLRCGMCPFWRRPDEYLLSLEEEKKMLSALEDFGISFMGFEGGEPFLRKDLPEILDYSHSRFHTSIVTNGWLLKERLNSVKENLDYVFVSIDGIGKTHDRLRGREGSFQRAVEGVKAASEFLPVSFNTTITAENSDEVGAIVNLARDLGVAVSFQVAHDYTSAEKKSPSDIKLKEAIASLL